MQKAVHIIQYSFILYFFCVGICSQLKIKEQYYINNKFGVYAAHYILKNGVLSYVFLEGPGVADYGKGTP